MPAIAQDDPGSPIVDASSVSSADALLHVRSFSAVSYLVYVPPVVTLSRSRRSQDRLPTIYWLPKLHKTPYKARFIANSSSCTTTELSKLLTSCLTAVTNHVIRYCEKVYERSGKNLFWSIKNSGEVLNKLKSRGFRATSLSTYDFSTLYALCPII